MLPSATFIRELNFRAPAKDDNMRIVFNAIKDLRKSFQETYELISKSHAILFYVNIACVFIVLFSLFFVAFPYFFLCYINIVCIFPYFSLLFITFPKLFLLLYQNRMRFSDIFPVNLPVVRWKASSLKASSPSPVRKLIPVCTLSLTCLSITCCFTG